MYTLIQSVAPDFTSDAVLADGTLAKVSLSDFRNKKYVVLFFYPLNFTFVCPSEILAFSNRIQEFEKRNVTVLGVSIDSHYAHKAWRDKDVNNGGIGPVKFTLVSDIDKTIAKNFHVLINNSVALRGTFLIDKSGIVRHITVNDLNIGRNIDETLRTVDALQFSEKHGQVCPAGWRPGDKAITPNAQDIQAYIKEFSDKL